MVKCRFCKKEINKENAYVVIHGKQNWYYCNYNHSVSINPRDKMFGILEQIFGKTTNTLFYNMFDKIANVHGYDKVSNYAEENKEYLIKTMSRDFAKEYNKIMYFAAIFKNNLADYQLKTESTKEVILELQNNTKYKSKSKRKGLDLLLEELVE